MKALSSVLPNSQIPFACNYVRIVCSLCNAFKPPLVTSLKPDAVIAKKGMTLTKSPNKLQQKAIEKKWDKMFSIWKTKTETDMPDLP